MTLLYIPHIPRKPASINEAAAPFVGNPLWRLASGGRVGYMYKAMSRQKDLLLKDLLLKCRGHFKSRSFKNRSCAIWIHRDGCSPQAGWPSNDPRTHETTKYKPHKSLISLQTALMWDIDSCKGLDQFIMIF